MDQKTILETSSVSKINLKGKRIIIADVDDTICYSREQITEPMAEQINSMIKRGYRFAFISGTKLEHLREMISSRVNEEHHILAMTGTTYAVISNGNSVVQYSQALTKKEKQEIITALERLTVKYNLKPLTSKKDQIQDRESQVTLSVLGRYAPLDLKRQYDPDGSKRKEFVVFLRTFLHQEKYEITIGGTTSIDITKKGLDKERGIREFLKWNDFSPSEVLFFGDKLYPGGNDYSATKVVDCIAVKNPEETLERLKELFS